MNRAQEDKLSMFYVVRHTCEKYRDTWAGNAVFAATYGQWAAKIPLIEQNRDAQLLEISGITVDKLAKRKSMTDKALFAVNRLRSYATVANNPELRESVKYSATDLKKSRDSDLAGICGIVAAKASAHAAAIAAYGVSAAVIGELQAAIASFMAVIAKPKSAKSQAKTGTENIARLLREANELLTMRMDLDIEQFRTLKPEFYSQYKSARIISATKGRVSAVVGRAASAATGEGLKGVTFTFVPEPALPVRETGHDRPRPVVKKSAAKGRFRVPLPENTYRVTAEKLGYKKQMHMVTVVSGERTYLDVALERD